MSTRSLVALSGVVVLGALAVGGVSLRAQREAIAAPTFNQDVAPILYNNCVTCHSPGQVAPMSLLSYKEARPWARAIKKQVASREMPPWPADPRFGVFRTGHNLSQAEIDTIIAWADHGAAQGPGTPPPTPTQAADGWSHPSGRPPDLIVEMPVEVDIPAQGLLPWWDLVQSWPFQEDKFIEAVEVLPGNRAVLHHMTVGFRKLQPGMRIGPGPAWPGGPIISNAVVNADGTAVGRRSGRQQTTAQLQAPRESGEFAQLSIYVPPRGFRQYRPGIGMRIPKDSVLSWGIHYNMTGRPEKDRSRVGLWFQQVPFQVETKTRYASSRSHPAFRDSFIVQGTEVPEAVLLSSPSCATNPCLPEIPAHDGNYAATAISAFLQDTTLYTFWPHMHVRGKDMTYIVTYPDGREEVLLHVPRFNFNWQFFYELVEPVKVPAGSTLKVIAHFDNSATNRENPSPEKAVFWSEQSWDEMLNGHYEFSLDNSARPVTSSSANE